MNQEEEAIFVRQLTQATRSKKLRWSPTAFQDKFVASFKGNYAITIEKAGPDEEGDIFYIVEMIDEKKRTMLDLRLYGSGTELFDEARNIALNVDQAVKDILAELGE